MAKIHHFLSDTVLKKAAILRKLTLELSQRLPTQFIGHCQVAEASPQHLTIAVSSPAWSNQLRYHLPALKKHYPRQHIRILVSPEMAGLAQRQRVREPRQLDQQASQTIAASAQSINDKGLKNALLRLAQQGENKEK